ncbi:hypothetical protein [Helicobacter rodentium]|uniref:hypothetical protein n=2 Tax=Helicobacter rodentium TaxID=59617 RepID=UPI0023F0CA7F|nr:hypothetical protein [Helicobacter rodentium]
MDTLLKLFGSSEGGISTALYGVIVSLFFALVFVGWLYKGALEEIANLEVNLQIAQGNTAILQESLQKQNEAIVALRVEKTHKDTSAVDRIIIKDSSCVAELEGYKELFKELGK